MHVLITGNTAFKLVNFRSGLISELVKNGSRVTALVPIDKYALTLEEMGCELVPLRVHRKGIAPHQELLLILKFWQVFRDKRPDVILSFTIKNNIYGAFAARMAGITIIPNITGLGTAFAEKRVLNRIIVAMYRASFRRVPVVFFQNHDDPVLFTDANIVRSSQVKILPGSGVDTERFFFAPLPGKGKKLAFLMVARLLRDKGVSEFVDAARIVKKKHPQVRFQLLGPFDFDNRSAINKARVRLWEDEGFVEYLGELDDVRPAIVGADCVVLPSYYREGIPRALLEAASMGRPTVTTNSPGCREAVDDGATGLLCRPRDVSDLVLKIENIINMGDRGRVEMGRRARHRMEQSFEEKLVINAYLDELKYIDVPSVVVPE